MEARCARVGFVACAEPLTMAKSVVVTGALGSDGGTLVCCGKNGRPRYDDGVAGPSSGCSNGFPESCPAVEENAMDGAVSGDVPSSCRCLVLGRVAVCLVASRLRDRLASLCGHISFAAALVMVTGVRGKAFSSFPPITIVGVDGRPRSPVFMRPPNLSAPLRTARRSCSLPF